MTDGLKPVLQQILILFRVVVVGLPFLPVVSVDTVSLSAQGHAGDARGIRLLPMMLIKINTVTTTPFFHLQSNPHAA